MSKKTSPGGPSDWRDAFIERYELPEDYRAFAQLWFDPLVADIAVRQSGAQGALLVGLNGSQGSGKTTLAAYLVTALDALYGISAFGLSLDDVYLGHEARQSLATDIHPLLATRGVPGTHDLPLLESTLSSLGSPEAFPLHVVGFDKASDDRQPEAEWRLVTAPPQVIILEGWCLGARPQSKPELAEPINALERDEDADGAWRAYVNLALEAFEPIYARVDYWVMLAAPSFDCVLNWRSQQEAALARHHPEGRALMDSAALERFVQHFQRLTEHCLHEMPDRVDYLLTLDAARDVTFCRCGDREVT